jgi:transposase
VPTIPSSIIDPIWNQCSALLPAREVHHPLGCHRPCLPDRIVVDQRVQVLVLACAAQRIADATVSATTLHRRDEWITAGVIDTALGLMLGAYDLLIGLKLADLRRD